MRINPYIAQGDVQTIFTLLAQVLSFLYCGVMMAYIVLVLMRTNFRYGYYRPELKPGPLVDDRLSYPWWFLLFSNFRLVVLPALLWVRQNASLRYGAIVLGYLFKLFVALDIILLLVWGIFGGFFCNKIYFRNGLCDTPNVTLYCQALWKNHPELCNPGATPPLVESGDLPFADVWYALIYFTLGFLALDVIVVLYLYAYTSLYRAFLPPPRRY